MTFPATFDADFHDCACVYMPLEDWRWFKAQAMAESGINQAAISRCGAIGIMQLMPATAKGLGVDPHNALENIQGGIKYDSQCWNFWKSIPDPAERRKFMFASYNAGPGNIQKAAAIAKSVIWDDVAAVLHKVTGPYSSETVAYVKRIHDYFAELA